MAGVSLLLADVDFLDFVFAAMSQDFIEHLGQKERVNDMAGEFDVFHVHGAPIRSQSRIMRMPARLPADIPRGETPRSANLWPHRATGTYERPRRFPRWDTRYGAIP